MHPMRPMTSITPKRVTTVTAMIPCYNAAQFIEEAIASTQQQTRPPDEIIVIDDCSTDGSGDIAERMGVRVLRTAVNGGGGAARNLGIREARGDVVAWLDADDFWEPHHLATVVGLLEQHPDASLAFSLVREFGDRSGIWAECLPAGSPCDALEACLHRCVVPHISVVVFLEALRNVGGYDESMRVGADYDIWLRLSAVHRFVCTHEITANWRQHDSQISGGSGGGGKLFAYWEMEYASRARFLSATQASGDLDRFRLVEALMIRVSQSHLMCAWWARDERQLAFHLERVPDVADARALRQRWRRRARMLHAARVWDAVRSSARAIVRTLTGGSSTTFGKVP